MNADRSLNQLVSHLGVRIFTETDGEVEVWRGVEGLNNIINAHIIGTGRTREEAVAAAVWSAESLCAVLQSPVGVIPEIDLRAPQSLSDAHVATTITGIDDALCQLAIAVDGTLPADAPEARS